ncbi:MAG: rhodanese-like domain-containing protein [Finegoldia magna]|nr:rhodanese-like domain-containing protein [Finegoldia magna]
MKKLLLTLALVSALTVTGCSNNSDKPADNNTKTEENAEKPAENKEEKTEEKAAIKEMKGADLEAIEHDRKNKDKILIVDVRSKEEYDQGHVKWAINIPIDTFEQKVSKLDFFKDKAVITICNSGKKSQKAAEILVDKGFKDVTNAEGVKKFEYKLVKFAFILPGDLVRASEDTNNVIVDVEDKKEYDASHIKNAISIPLDEADARLSEIPTDKPVYIYSINGNKSAELAQKLIDRGNKEVFNSFLWDLY